MSGYRAGRGGSGKLPGDYEYKVNDAGQLELWKGDEKVAMQSPDGSWFVDNISTGVGSLHLGGNESGGVAHSISSCGQNVGFLNEFSRANQDDKLFFFPSWQGMETDGSGLVPPSVLDFGALQYDSYPNGQPAPPASVVPYQFNFDAIDNFVTYAISIVTAEVYGGKLTLRIKSRVTGAEIYSSESDFNFVSGQTVTVKYRYPFFARTGDALTFELLKEDGSPLLVRAGQTRLSEPYRSLRMRTFTDRLVTGAAIGDVKHSYRTTDHDGWVTTNGRAISSLSVTQRANLVAAGINWTSVPNTQGLVTMASSASYTVGSLGGSYTIDRSALPNFTLTGKTDFRNTDHVHDKGSLVTGTESAGHTHTSGSLTASSSGSAHAHNLARTAMAYTGNTFSGTNGGDGDGDPVGATQTDGAHSHSITGSTGDRSATHTHAISGNTAGMNTNTQHDHTFTTPSINGNVTQAKHLQPYVALTQFVFVGL